LSSCCPALLGHEQSGGLPLDRGCNQDRARLAGALDSRGDIGRVAEHLAGRVDHHLPGIKADPRLKLRGAFAGVSGVEFDKRALDGERRAHGTLSVVLLGLRIAEECHQPVAELLQHMTAKIGNRSRSLVEIAVDEVAPVFGVQLRGETRRADEIAEHDSDRGAFGRGFACGRIMQPRIGERERGQMASTRLKRQSRRAAFADLPRWQRRFP
jgi:hypothetical protein